MVAVMMERNALLSPLRPLAASVARAYVYSRQSRHFAEQCRCPITLRVDEHPFLVAVFSHGYTVVRTASLGPNGCVELRGRPGPALRSAASFEAGWDRVRWDAMGMGSVGWDGCHLAPYRWDTPMPGIGVVGVEWGWNGGAGFQSEQAQLW